ncbi:MAG: hypothetical protein J2P54_13230 [Bradyrhizobiaceae bacterium]|nr:hypothetical protein [Bradyrhizobiaceae bacterium]
MSALMILLSIVCILIGAMLGLKFRVLVLVPATAICIFLVLLVELSSGAGAAWTVIVAVIAAALLQFGYLGGVAMSFFVAEAEPKTALVPRRLLDRAAATTRR